MKKSPSLLFIACVVSVASFAQSKSKQDSLEREAAKTEIYEPVPKMVTPGLINTNAPSDAIQLYNGKDLSHFHTKNGAPAGWKIEKDGALTIVKGSGNLITNQLFGDCQLHLEWREPSVILDSGQLRGNSGVYFMSRYELQIMDSYNNPTYVNGQAGSIYKQHIPLVNASKKPGEWQSYDVVFIGPKFYSDGKIQTPARITVFQNGVLIQNNVAIKGGSQWIGQPKYVAHGEKEPLFLQDHGLDGGQPISYRNIWIRDLDLNN